MTPRSQYVATDSKMSEVLWKKKNRSKISKSRVSYIPESLDICSLSNHGTRASGRNLRIA